MEHLRPYQEAGAAWLAGRKHALLADEPGLGKTAQAIAACDAVGADTVLVVCPASVVENWKREFRKFGRNEEIILTVVSYDHVVRRDVLKSLTAAGPTFDVLILDEAHYLKERGSKRTQAIFGAGCDGVDSLIAKSDCVILLTGTPMPNHSAEIWPALRALAPETITSTSGKPYSYWQFVQKFCKTRDNGFGIQIVEAKNHDDLRKRLEGFMLRRLKSEVATDLPPITFDELYLGGDLRLPPEVAAENADLVRWATDDGTVEGLREVAPHVATLRRLTGLVKAGPVVQWVKDWFEGGGGKLVLFAHHREVMKAINTDPRLNHILRCMVAGDTPTEKRQEHVDAFQRHEGPAIFIGQIQAAGTGITLTASSDVLFVESSWVPAENSQAAMRVHRIGQKNACTVRFATLAGSIDEQIQRAVRRKTADITQILD